MNIHDEIRLLQARLAEIDVAHEKTEGTGAILVGPGVYLSDFPYLFSADIRAAFVFKNCAQAPRTLADSAVCKSCSSEAERNCSTRSPAPIESTIEAENL
jgi:hypothetical protein